MFQALESEFEHLTDPTDHPVLSNASSFRVLRAFVPGFPRSERNGTESVNKQEFQSISIPGHHFDSHTTASRPAPEPRIEDLAGHIPDRRWH